MTALVYLPLAFADPVWHAEAKLQPKVLAFAMSAQLVDQVARDCQR